MSAYRKGNVFYIGEFDGEMEQNILTALVTETQKQSELRDGRLDLYVNSYGGVKDIADHVVQLMEVAKAHEVTVRTIITGAAYSAGSMVAVAGSEGERYMAKTSLHLVHYGASMIASRSPVEAERNHTVDKLFYRQVKNHYRNYCEIPDDILDAGLDIDMWHITYAEAKRWKMCDKPLDRLNING